MKRNARASRRRSCPAAKSIIRRGGITDAAQYAGLYSKRELRTDRANAGAGSLELAGLN